MPRWLANSLTTLTAVLMLVVFAVGIAPDGKEILGNRPQWIFQKDSLSGGGFYISHRSGPLTSTDFELYLPRTYIPFAVLMIVAIVPGMVVVLCRRAGLVSQIPTPLGGQSSGRAAVLARTTFAAAMLTWLVPCILVTGWLEVPVDRIAIWVWIAAFPITAILGTCVSASMPRQRRVVESAYWMLVVNLCIFGLLGL